MTILIIIASMWITWLFYIAVMHLKQNKDQITKYNKPFAYLTLGIGLVINFLFNTILGTLFFLQIPKELGFSPRVSRNLTRTGWRKREAEFWRDNFLAGFDPSGGHDA